MEGLDPVEQKIRVTVMIITLSKEGSDKSYGYQEPYTKEEF